MHRIDDTVVPADLWLEVAEERFRRLAESHDELLPPEVADLLSPRLEPFLRLALWAQVRPEMLAPVPGRCEIPWLGCRRHGDLLGFGGDATEWGVGWACSVAGCGFRIQQPLARLRHCRRRAVAVLGEPGGHTLRVCSGHLMSERQLAESGEPFMVRPTGRRRGSFGTRR